MTEAGMAATAKGANQNELPDAISDTPRTAATASQIPPHTAGSSIVIPPWFVHDTSNAADPRSGSPIRAKSAAIAFVGWLA